MDDEQGSSGRQSLSSSVAQPGSGFLTEAPGTSSGSLQNSDDNIEDFLKALEDNKWSQDRFSKVGGIGLAQLLNLEVTLCFLLDFDLWVDEAKLCKSMFLLQQAARMGIGARGKLSEFRLRPPPRRSIKAVPAAA